MRILNLLAALSGLVALALLAYASLAQDDIGEWRAVHVRVVALVQLISASVGVFAAGRGWRLDFVAGTSLVAGSALVTLIVALYALANIRDLDWIGHLGGLTIALGWLLLAAARPPQEREQD